MSRPETPMKRSGAFILGVLYVTFFGLAGLAPLLGTYTAYVTPAYTDGGYP